MSRVLHRIVNALDGPEISIKAIKRSWRRTACHVNELVQEGKEKDFDDYYRLVIAAIRRRDLQKIENMLRPLDQELNNFHSDPAQAFKLNMLPPKIDVQDGQCSTRHSEQVTFGRKRPALHKIDVNALPTKRTSASSHEKVTTKDHLPTQSFGTDPKAHLLVSFSNAIEESMTEISKEIESKLE
ncbi:hypothetical protein QAD02_018445 [Eretmocerus hayati]|uniref:Uncharacterized protein n=1 Tax=Eretmocerus hayati TaxID=131215 RepID=A0ACC2PHT8_9HYME|nr:hypothetical protein QAD02_018445 [Eretmocerus hayati]